MRPLLAMGDTAALLCSAGCSDRTISKDQSVVYEAAAGSLRAATQFCEWKSHLFPHSSATSKSGLKWMAPILSPQDTEGSSLHYSPIGQGRTFRPSPGRMGRGRQGDAQSSGHLARHPTTTDKVLWMVIKLDSLQSFSVGNRIRK